MPLTLDEAKKIARAVNDLTRFGRDQADRLVRRLNYATPTLTWVATDHATGIDAPILSVSPRRAARRGRKENA